MLFVRYGRRYLLALNLLIGRMLETEFEDLQRRLKAPLSRAKNAHTKQLKQELEEYFLGRPTKTLPCPLSNARPPNFSKWRLAKRSGHDSFMAKRKLSRKQAHAV